MKRNLLAIAIPALLVAGVANAAEMYNKDGNKVNIYGRVKAANYINTSGSGSDASKERNGDHTEARIGFLGETQITDSLVGYGRAEWQQNISGDSNDDNGKSETRYAYAGFKFSDWGSIDYGKNDGITKTVVNYTDVLPEFGGDSKDAGDILLAGREKRVLTYRNDNFFGLADGFKFAFQYQDGDSNTGSGTTWDRTHKGALGLSVEYENILDTGLSAAASYAQSNGKEYFSDHKLRTYAAGLKYELDDLYLAAIYMNSKAGNYKHHDFEVVAQYGFDFDIGRFTPSIAYLQGTERGTRSRDWSNVKYIELGATYDFNRNMSAILDYKFDLIKDMRDQLALGIIYRF